MPALPPRSSPGPCWSRRNPGSQGAPEGLLLPGCAGGAGQARAQLVFLVPFFFLDDTCAVRSDLTPRSWVLNRGVAAHQGCAGVTSCEANAVHPSVVSGAVLIPARPSAGDE